MGLVAKVGKNRTGSEELDIVVAFLRQRFEDHRKIYGSSFAQQLNNEAAVEMAEAMFSTEAVVRARELLRENVEVRVCED